MSNHAKKTKSKTKTKETSILEPNPMALRVGGERGGLADAIFGTTPRSRTNMNDSSGTGISFNQIPTAQLYFQRTEPLLTEKQKRKKQRCVEDNTMILPDPQEEDKGLVEVAPLQPTRGDPAATVFVGNLPPSTTKRSLTRLFRPYGEVHSVRLRDFVPSGYVRRTNARDATAMHGENASGNIFGYVCFTDVVSVEASLELDGTTLDTHILRVNRADDKKAAHFQAKNSVFVGNIPRSSTEAELAAFFKAHGIPSVQHVRLVRDPTSGQGRGFGFASFADAAGMQKALSLAGADFMGRPLRVTETMDRKQPKSSNGTRPTKRSRERGLGNVIPKEAGAHAWQGVIAQKASSITNLPKKVRALMKIK